MTDRAIYTIDLDDSAFKKFAETFERFKKESATVQSGWKANEKLIAAATANFKKMGGDPTRAPRETGKSLADAMDAWSGAGWISISSAAKIFNTNIRTATGFLAKWTGITTVIGSLMSAGGIYGMTRLAQNVGQRRSSAQQLGTTWGAQAAASGAFLSIPGASRIISGLSDATASQQGMAPLFNLMGGQAERLRGGDPVESFVSMLPYLKGLADQGGSWGSMNERLRAMGLDKLGVGVDTLRLLRGMKPDELKEMIGAYREAEPRMRLTERDQKAMQDFATAIEESETSISTIFARRLVHFAPIVERMVDPLTRIIEVMGKDNGPIAHFLEKLDRGLTAFGNKIDDPQFQRDARKYVEDIAVIATGISQLTLTSLSDRIGKFNKYWNPFGVISRAISPEASQGSTGAAPTGPWQNRGPSGSGTSGTEGGTTPSVPRAVGGSRSATGAGNQPGATTPSEHRPHLGPVPMPWTTRDKGGTSPSAILSGKPSAPTTPRTSRGSNAPLPIRSEGLTAEDRQSPQHIAGPLKMGDNTFHFGSGGAGRHIPYGDYPITPDAIGPWGRAHGAIGINGNVIFDPILGRNRLGIELHPSNRGFTAGCVGIPGKEFPDFKQGLRERISRYGPQVLHIGPDGARIYTRGDSATKESKEDRQSAETMLFLHGMQSRYGNMSPREIEASAKEYAALRGFGFESISVSGDYHRAQYAAARERILKGGITGVYGFSAGGYTARDLLKDPAIREKIRHEVVVGSPGVSPSVDDAVIYGNPPQGHMQGPQQLMLAERMKHEGGAVAAPSSDQRTGRQKLLDRSHHPALQGQQSHVEVHDNSGGDGNIHVSVAQRGPLTHMPTMHMPGYHPISDSAGHGQSPMKGLYTDPKMEKKPPSVKTRELKMDRWKDSNDLDRPYVEHSSAVKYPKGKPWPKGVDNPPRVRHDMPRYDI